MFPLFSFASKKPLHFLEWLVFNFHDLDLEKGKGIGGKGGEFGFVYTIT